MLRYMLKRLFMMIVTLWIIVTLTFVLMVSVFQGHLLIVNNHPNEIVQANLEAHYNLDKPYFIQYLLYIKSIVTFDFGPSI